MSPWLDILIGLICAGVGGEFFVRGTVGLARRIRVSCGIVASTLAAFATSAPELSVAINSAITSHPEISLGDAVGSNLVNIGLVLGLTLCVSEIKTSRAGIRRDLSAALLIPPVLAVLSLDGHITRLDGILLLALFSGWLATVGLSARRERDAAALIPSAQGHWRAALPLLAGLALLVIAGRFIVSGANGIAVVFGISDFLIGATLVAIGTSIPELATSLISKLRGYDEISVGTILGSNIFNGFFIVGIAALICPIRVEGVAVHTALFAGLLTTATIVPSVNGLIPRRRGALLLTIYAAYVIWELSRL